MVSLQALTFEGLLSGRNSSYLIMTKELAGNIAIEDNFTLDKICSFVSYIRHTYLVKVFHTYPHLVQSLKQYKYETNRLHVSIH